jgi:hypothetical protein
VKVAKLLNFAQSGHTDWYLDGHGPEHVVPDDGLHVVILLDVAGDALHVILQSILFNTFSRHHGDE